MSRQAGRPNAVYERTRTGLAGLVPSRAASRILDAGLVAERRTKHAVSAEEMVRVLLGPVLRDLSQVLPAAGVQRELEHLARTLRPKRRARPTPAPQPPPDPTGHQPTPRTAPTAEAADPPDPISPSEVRTPVPPPRRERLLPDDHDLVLAALAPLDGVAGVAVFDPHGTVVSVRGDLPDPDALGPVLAVCGELLGRHGPVRSVCLATTSGVLVAVRVPPRWIAVTGRTDLNQGAVYAALRALEEER